MSEPVDVEAFKTALEKSIQENQTKPLHDEIQKLTKVISDMKLQVDLNSNEPLIPNSRGMAMPRPENPDKFNGEKRSECRGFMAQIDNLFKLHPHAFPNDDVKISYVGTLLSGKAKVWFTPFIENPNKYRDVLETYDSFKTHFKATFGEVDQANVSATKLKLLRQGTGTVSAYFAEFNRLASDLSWDDSALIHQFKWGLSEEINRMLVFAPNLPDKLSEYALVAISCDNRIREAALIATGYFGKAEQSKYSPLKITETPRSSFAGYPNFYSTNSPVPPIAPAPTPPANTNQSENSNYIMDIDAIRSQGFQRPSQEADCLLK